MNKYKTFTEHDKIDKYLRRRSFQLLQNKEIINYEDKLSNFPIGLIIITKEPQMDNEDILEFMNQYACKLFEIKDNKNIYELKSKFEEYIKLKSNNNTKTSLTLKDVIFNSPPFNFEIENFFPFQCKQSKNTILYIKIQDIENKKYIVIDKYDKYMEEQKYIEFNLIKNINYQYLHTLYHELNNPLNALIAISGENKQNMESTHIVTKPTIVKEKTYKSHYKRKSYKRDKFQSGQISLEHLKYKIINSHTHEMHRSRKKSLFDNNYSYEVSSKINLLVKIIKIFIKNFILYLKTRADNLLMLINEFKMQNESSDIKNCVEVSDYEKDLTDHKKVKLNLEYILDLYLNKYHCLFKYKEIEFETNFKELKNVFVATDDFNFSYFIRQIYTYLYYVVPKKEGFCFEYNYIDDNQIEILIKKKPSGNITKRTDISIDFPMNQLIQTKEMTKEVLYSMSKKLNFHLEIYDTEDKEENNYLSIILPIIKKDKTTEDDEFKDEDIGEMVEDSNFLMEEKLKRNLPKSPWIGERKNSHVSSLNFMDGKNYEDKKETIESFISLSKNINFKNENNTNSILNSNYIGNTSNNLNNNNDAPKGNISRNSLASNDSVLSKYLKDYEKKCEKEKSKFRKDSNVNIKLIKNEINNHSSNKNIIINITNINNSPKRHRYTKTKSHVELNKIIKTKDNSENKIKSQKTQKLKEILTIINNFGYSDDMELDENIDSFDSYESKKKKFKNYKNYKNYKNEFTFKESSLNQSIKGKSITINNYNNINSNYNSNYIYNSNYNSNINSNLRFDMNKRSSDAQGSVKTGIFGIKNNMKSNIKSSCFISEINGDNDEKNKSNINNNNNKNIIQNDLTKLEKVGVTIEYSKDSKLLENSKITNNNNKHKNSKNLLMSEIEEFGKKKRNSENLDNNLNTSKDCKDAMTFCDKNKLNNAKNNKNNNANSINNFKESMTVTDDNVVQNKNLFLDANKERQLYLKETENKSKKDTSNYISEENEESVNPSEDICNCADLLVVDDEEFNVMASQKMFSKLGYLTDKAYNGQECIDLIIQKGKSKCKCGKNYYKIIFLDIVMPVMDGIQAAHKVQEMIDNKGINENVKIVFVSGNIDGPDLKKSLLEINCVKECLQKPVQIAKYQKILEKYYQNK